MRKLARLAAATVGAAALAITLTAPVAANASTSAAQRAAATTQSSAIPNIQKQSCTGRPTWVHVYGLNNTWFCLGGTGSYHPNSWKTALCAGNNYGHWIGHDDRGTVYDVNFGPGDVFPFGGFPGSEIYLTDVTITGWSGSDGCPPL